MINKQIEPFKEEFRRLVIVEGFNDNESVVIMLIRFWKTIIPISIVAWIVINKIRK